MKKMKKWKNEKVKEKWKLRKMKKKEPLTPIRNCGGYGDCH